MHKRGLTISVVLGAAWLASACGGTSESTTFTDTGGTGAGGSSANVGGNKSTGTGAQNADAGASDTALAGGTTSGGTKGEDPGPVAGGAPSEPGTPDPTVREGCKAWCDGVVAAACDDTSLSDCLFGCRAVANSAPCNARYADLFACAKDASFSCNKDDDAVPEGCELKYAQTVLCVLSSPDETIAEPCQAYCDTQDAAACANSTPAAECAYGCQVQSALVPACAKDWKTFITCAQDAEVTCNTNGDAVPQSCIAPYLTYLACVVEAGQ